MLNKKGNIAVLKNNKLSLLEVDTELMENKPTIGYEDIKENVGGYIEQFAFNLCLAENKIDCWCDEDGKLKNLPISVVVCDKDTQIIEVINGPIVFTGNDGHGESIPLNENQIKIIKQELSLIANVDLGNGEKADVRILRWDTYETRRNNKANKYKSIIEISDAKEKRDCNTCGKHCGGEVKIELGKNNSSHVIFMCKECLNIFSEKVWDYLLEAETND